jgi:translation initiation factor IF-1
VAKADNVELEGVVTEVTGGGLYRVKTTNGHLVLCTLNGKMKQFKITVVMGDEVKIEVSPYDLTKGRITFRVRGR